MSNITKLVNEYLELKPQEKELKDKIGEINSNIKSYFAETGEDTVTTSKGSVYLSERKSDSYDEEGMIEFIKSLGLRGIVKKKEYIDFDALESALYHEKFSEEQKKELNKFKTTKITKVLNIGKVKGE